MADFTQEQLQAEAIRRGLIPAAPDTSATAQEPFLKSRPFGYAPEILRGAQNFVGGVMGGAQRLGATLGEAGQAVGELASPLRKLVPDALKIVPDVNIREEMGLAGPNQVDLNKMISNDPDSFMSSIGRFSPAIASGGASIPGQAVAMGLWSAVQANPDEENLGGYLPEGRGGAAIKDAALTAGVGYGAKLAAKAIPYVGKAINYIRPNKSAAEFLKTLGSGTKEENVQALAKDIDNAYQAKLKDALSHKEPVYEQEGQSHIYNTPTTALPEGNLDKVAHYIAPGEEYTPQQLEALGQEIKNYRSGKVGKDPYDFDDFTHNVSEIFNADMNATQVANLEHALSIPTKSASSFLDLVEKNPKLIQGKTQELFDIFKRRQTLKNADKLQSQIGKQMGKYSERAEKSGLSTGEDLELQQLKEMRDSLKTDMQGHLERVNPKLAEENKIYSDKFRDNVIPYKEEVATKSIANEPKHIKDMRAENPSLPYNVTSSQMMQAFAEPSRAALQITGDIGEAGRNKILYNLLADDTKPEAKGLANAILQAKQSKGYSQYVTPEMEDFALQLLKRVKMRDRASLIGKFVGGGLVGTGVYEGAKKLF